MAGLIQIKLANGASLLTSLLLYSKYYHVMRFMVYYM